MKEDSIVDHAAELFGMEPMSEDLSVGDASSQTYRCVRDGSGFYLKISEWELAETEERIEASELLELLAKASTDDIRFVTPARSSRRNLIEEIVHNDQIYRVSASVEAPGRSLDTRKADGITPSDIRKAGRIGGRLHRLSTQLPKWRSRTEVERSGDDVAGSEIGIMKSFDRMIDGLPEKFGDSEVCAAFEEITGRMRKLPISREVYGFTNVDIGFGNIVADGEVWTVIDPVPTYGWFLISVASGTYYMGTRDSYEARAFWKSYREGYVSEMEYDPWWERHLLLFLSHRRIMFYLLMSSFAASNAEYRSRLRPDILESMRSDIVHGVPIIDFEIA